MVWAWVLAVWIPMLLVIKTRLIMLIWIGYLISLRFASNILELHNRLYLLVMNCLHIRNTPSVSLLTRFGSLSLGNACRLRQQIHTHTIIQQHKFFVNKATYRSLNKSFVSCFGGGRRATIGTRTKSYSPSAKIRAVIMRAKFVHVKSIINIQQELRLVHLRYLQIDFDIIMLWFWWSRGYRQPQYIDFVFHWHVWAFSIFFWC